MTNEPTTEAALTPTVIRSEALRLLRDAAAQSPQERLKQTAQIYGVLLDLAATATDQRNEALSAYITARRRKIKRRRRLSQPGWYESEDAYERRRRQVSCEDARRIMNNEWTQDPDRPYSRPRRISRQQVEQIYQREYPLWTTLAEEEGSALPPGAPTLTVVARSEEI